MSQSSDSTSTISSREESVEDEQQQPGETQEEMASVYVVEKVVGKRIVDGNVEYKIRWVGYEEDDDSWEEARTCYCDDSIRQFEEENKDLQPEVITTTGGGVAKKGKGKKKNNKRKGGAARGGGGKSKKRKKSDEEEEKEEQEVVQTQHIPCVEKESYHLQEEGVEVYLIMGITRLVKKSDAGADIEKKMALVNYVDNQYEFVPVELLRTSPTGKELLLGYLLERLEFE